MNNGAGAFGARVDYPVGGPGQDLAAGDFNGDGRLDLVVTINDPQVGLSLLTGNGDGTFGAPVTFPNTSGFDSPVVAAVDLNNDGKLDVVVAHQIACYTAPCVVTEVISVMLGNGDGSFRPSREIQVGRGMAEIAVGDYNRDGFKDLALAGVEFPQPPVEQSWGWWSMFEDQEGNRFALGPREADMSTDVEA